MDKLTQFVDTNPFISFLIVIGIFSDWRATVATAALVVAFKYAGWV